MARALIRILLFILLPLSIIYSQNFEQDIFSTLRGPLKITFFGHASLRLEWAGHVIYVDPVSQLADYSQLPKADLILVTHDHYDHFDVEAISLLSHEKTVVVLTQKCSSKFTGGKVIANGETINFKDISIEAVPAYNLVHLRSQGVPYHPKGEGNGYVLTLGDKRIYIAGDTENIPEMKNLKNIEIAFLPMNLPYTMTPEMVADAARAIKPKILYPYHYGESNLNQLIDLLKEEKGIEVRIRKLK